MEQITLNTFPDSNEIWSGIGGHFDSLGQIINEFVDNSISNFEANNPLLRYIFITLKEVSTNGDVSIRIEDSGTGIRDLDQAFTLGSKKAAESPLNEHGFGLKHALASANPQNDSWCVYTRTEEDLSKNQFKKIAAPYQIGSYQCSVLSEPWPGQLNTGTIVDFTCSRAMYATLARGIPGGMKSFVPIANILHEDLGFTYSGIIKENKVNITLVLIDTTGNKKNYPVGAVEPSWDRYINPSSGTETVDLGNGNVIIEYEFGQIVNKNDRTDFDNTTTRKYYKQNMSSSGVEIRLNGRMLCNNLFKEVWGKEKHNSYNNFLVRLNLKSNDRGALPQTRTSKNGLREGDERLDALYNWIRSCMHEPVKELSLATHETDLFESLKQNMLQYNPDPNKVVDTEMHVFTATGNVKDKVRIDLYSKSTDGIVIYEGKRDYTTSKDVYQLRMYWDGLVYDGISPDKGYLVAQSHPDSVATLVHIVNTMKDANGKHYNLELKQWAELGIIIK